MTRFSAARTALALAVLTLTAPAFAAGHGFYSGTSVGHASVGNPTTSPLTTSSDNVFGGFLGYRVNPNFGVEGSYIGVGRFANATQSGKADALALDAVGFLPLGEKFELIGKVGVADALGKSSRGGLSNENRFAATYGIGVQFNPTEKIGLRLGVDRYGASVNEGGTTHDYNSNVVALSFVYRF